MHKVTFKVNDIKSLPDSLDNKKKEYVANVSVLELATADIPFESNPREQDTKSRVFKDIKESILSFDGLFRYKNNGITINCNSLVFDNDKSKPITVTFNTTNEELKQGNLNGGHTLRACQKAYEEVLESDNKDEDMEKLADQSVLVRFFTGLKDIDDIVEVADAANTSVSVTPESFIEMGGGFQTYKTMLSDSLYEGKIQFKQFDKLVIDGETKEYPLDIKEMIALIWSVNSKEFPSDGYDKALVKPYSSKGSLVTKYEKEDGKGFEISSPKLKALLSIRDYIMVTSYSMYTTGRGRNDFQNLRISAKLNSSDIVDDFGYDPLPKFTLNRGALLPIISSFRRFEEQGSFQIKIMRQAWDEEGYKFINRLEQRAKDADSITELGKSVDTWLDCARSWDSFISRNTHLFN